MNEKPNILIADARAEHEQARREHALAFNQVVQEMRALNTNFAALVGYIQGFNEGYAAAAQQAGAIVATNGHPLFEGVQHARAA